MHEHDLKRLEAGEPLGDPESPALTVGQLRLRAMVLDSVASPHSRRNYAKALDLLFALPPAGRSPGRCSWSTGRRWKA